MQGDVADFVSRLRRVLPARWFGDTAPITDAVLSGFGVAWSAVYTLIEVVRAQARLLTSSGGFVDSFAQDFCGAALPRRSGESDASYIQRIGYELLRPRGTRTAMTTAMLQLTGQPAIVFEPARPMDTGGYATGGAGYGVAGGYGNLKLAYQSFLKVRRPHGAGIAQLAGYRTGGVLAYGSLALVQTGVPDSSIYASAASILPAGSTVWVQIQG